MARPISAPAVVEAYRDMGGVRKVARKFRVSPRRVLELLRANGVEVPKRDKINRAEARAMRDAGMSNKAIARHFNCAPGSVSVSLCRTVLPPKERAARRAAASAKHALPAMSPDQRRLYTKVRKCGLSRAAALAEALR